MAGAVRDLLTWVLRWWSQWTPSPVAGPYHVAVGGSHHPGTAAADLFFAGLEAGQAHEY